MAETNDLQLAKQAVQSLVGQFGITQVVYVDDYFEAHYDVEVVIGWLHRIKGKDFPKVAELLPGITLEAAPEIWIRELRNRWGQMPIEQQKETAANISKILGTHFYQDYQAANRLARYFPRRYAPTTLSPSQWVDRKKAILKKASPTSKILCMFDQDLSEAKNFQDAGTKSGMGLIKEIIAQGLQEVVICCLLTRTIDSIENEMSAWRVLADENEIALHDFLPLAKKRLTDDESPLLFADGMKKAMMNIFCEKWKQEAVNLIINTTKKAADGVKSVDVYDFDHMIFQMSLEEGVWEIETLVRIFQIFHRDEIREAILDTQTSARLNELIAALRPISSVPIDRETHRSFPQIRPLRNKELFESAQLMKHTPLDVGDIFEMKEGQVNYILLGQPCDLMVRGAGECAGKRASDHLMVPIVPLHRISQENYQKKQESYWRTHASIEYFYKDSNDIAEVVFSKALLIDVSVLDLSVLDPDGVCRLDMEKIPAVPSICTSGWKRHLEKLINQYRDVSENMEKLKKHVRRIKKQETKELIQNLVITPRSYSGRMFDFGLQRVGRYRRPAADRLLKAYTMFLSRDADDLDFAKKSNTGTPDQNEAVKTN